VELSDCVTEDVSEGIVDAEGVGTAETEGSEEVVCCELDVGIAELDALRVI
jgi:hypothetical protein